MTEKKIGGLRNPPGGRPSKGNKKFYLYVPPEVIQRFDAERGALTRGEFFLLVWANWKVKRSTAMADEVDRSIPQFDRIVRGMEIIRKYETDPYPIAAEHDILYCGCYETTYEQMTIEERRLMAVLGWLEIDDSWGFFT